MDLLWRILWKQEKNTQPSRTGSYCFGIHGAINGCSDGTISIREIIDYVELTTGKKAIIAKEGESAPYNGEPEYSINTEKAKNTGFEFTALHDWIFDLIDYYIQAINREDI